MGILTQPFEPYLCDTWSLHVIQVALGSGFHTSNARYMAWVSACPLLNRGSKDQNRWSCSGKLCLRSIFLITETLWQLKLILICQVWPSGPWLCHSSKFKVWVPKFLSSISQPLTQFQRVLGARPPQWQPVLWFYSSLKSWGLLIINHLVGFCSDISPFQKSTKRLQELKKNYSEMFKLLCSSVVC